MNDDQLKRAIEDKHDFTDLISHRGWRKLTEILSEQVRYRTDRVVLVPLGELQGVEQQEFMKGEISAYRTLLNYPTELLETATEIAKQIEMENVANGDEPDNE